MSDTSEIAIPPYKITFKIKEEIVMELDLYQNAVEAHFMDFDNEIMYTVDTINPID